MNDAAWKRVLRAWMEEHEAFGLESLPLGPEVAAAAEVGSDADATREAATQVPVAGGGAAAPSAKPPAAAPERAPLERAEVARKGGTSAPDRAGEPSQPSEASAPPATPRSPADELAAVAAEAAACERCELCRERTQVVPGQGASAARLVFVGEAPGAEEDRQGLAFVGPSGALLTKMIGAMGLGRDEVFIANVLKCRPPGNRDPQPFEVAACMPFLKRQLRAVGAECIVTLGAHAARVLLDTDVSVGRLRGKVHTFEGASVVATYHPAYLLRNEGMKRAAWQDLQLAMRVLGIEPPARGR